MGKVIDLTGQKFGRLTVIEYGGVTDHFAYWHCKCDCGNTIVVRGQSLWKGNTRSCGCLFRELSAQRMFNNSHTLVHGESQTRLYKVWVNMVSRCTNPDVPSYRYYGARGITVCDEWKNSYLAFREWAMENGYDENAPRGVCTLDRINNDGNYEPSNCRWVSMRVQSHNKRKRAARITLTFNGESHSMKEWADILGVHYNTILRRRAMGLPIEKILGNT